MGDGGCIARRIGCATLAALLSAELILLLIGSGLLIFLEVRVEDLLLPHVWLWIVLAVLVTLAVLVLISFISLWWEIPFLLLPCIVMSFGAVFLLCYVIVMSVLSLVHQWSWVNLLVCVICVFLLIFQFFSISVKASVFRMMVKRKKAVTITGMTIPTNKFESFSRRSTIEITDEFYVPPLKI